MRVVKDLTLTGTRDTILVRITKETYSLVEELSGRIECSGDTALYVALKQELKRLGGGK